MKQTAGEDGIILEKRYLETNSSTAPQGDWKTFIHPLEKRGYNKHTYAYVPELSEQGKLLLTFLHRWMFKEVPE